jgi:hypothetical protein
LKRLESNRANILIAEEFAWRLRSRETWLRCGDSNSKYFHKVASHNKQKKMIWSINKGGTEIRGQEALKKEAVSYFTNQYRSTDLDNLQDKGSSAQLFPRMVSGEEAEALYKPVTLDEIKDILLHFKAERSPGPDGWTSEFFCFFFELVGEELLQMVEDTRIKGKIAGSINSTFLVLIPKESSPVSFADFRPISLCNLIYKIISKVISNRIKPFLGRCLSAEQLGFLKGRRIHDAIGAAHECLHSIKQKNLKALVMKLDLKKAFDCIDWDFLRLILHAVGFGDNFSSWILACVTTANFAVLINGDPSTFFKSERGLRQGCPLSPYLFILIMEGLSILLSQSVSEQKISGIKVSNLVKIVHLMFVDDVLLLSIADPEEWRIILEVLQKFCSVSGLSINASKSSVHYWGLSETELQLLQATIPLSFKNLNEGFTYLGFHLKMGASSPADWHWLVTKFERKINFWCNKWLSLGGRLVLVQAVLQSLAVYWMLLEKVPSLIITTLRRLAFNFLWGATPDKNRYHLCSWQALSISKREGGWGLKNLFSFNGALLASSYWRAVSTESIWNKIISDKYLESKSLLHWLRKPSFQIKKASPFWKGLVNSSTVILHWLCWKPGDGSKILIGRDSIMGLGECAILSLPMRNHLQTLNLTTLSQIKKTSGGALPDIWNTVSDLHLRDPLDTEWTRFTSALKRAGISLRNEPDILMWAGGDQSGLITVKNIYLALQKTRPAVTAEPWVLKLWKLHLPLKLKLFAWLTGKNKLLTWDVLQTRGWVGPSVCPLCKTAPESLSHLLMFCSFSAEVWNRFTNTLIFG